MKTKFKETLLADIKETVKTAKTEPHTGPASAMLAFYFIFTVFALVEVFFLDAIGWGFVGFVLMAIPTSFGLIAWMFSALLRSFEV